LKFSPAGARKLDQIIARLLRNATRDTSAPAKDRVREIKANIILNYSTFHGFGEDADPGLPEVGDAKKCLAAVT
jgi:hypothetical protein